MDPLQDKGEHGVLRNWETSIWLLQKELEENSCGRYLHILSRKDVLPIVSSWRIWWSAKRCTAVSCFRWALSLESHLAQGTPFLKLPASGDWVRQGYRGTAFWPGGGILMGNTHPRASGHICWIYLTLPPSSPASAPFLLQVLILNKYRASQTLRQTRLLEDPTCNGKETGRLCVMCDKTVGFVLRHEGSECPWSPIGMDSMSDEVSERDFGVFTGGSENNSGGVSICDEHQYFGGAFKMHFILCMYFPKFVSDDNICICLWKWTILAIYLFGFIWSFIPGSPRNVSRREHHTNIFSVEGDIRLCTAGFLNFMFCQGSRL